MTRCAIYARYSSDLQRDTSIDDQVRRCEEYAQKNGWTVVSRFADKAISGADVAGRQQLQALMQEARAGNFDRLIVDDTSRLGRNLPQVRTLIDQLEYFDIQFSAVAQQIDSTHESSRQLLTLNCFMDEQYIVGLRDKVHRGQEGRALAGFNPGGKCFGYRNVPLEDASRLGKYGRPRVLGVQLEVIPSEAETIRRMYEMFAGGYGLSRIAKQLNAEGILSPQPARNRALRAWCPSSIRSMLHNERYRGVFVWNRTRKRKNPETGLKTSRPRPTGDSRRVSVPSWRIIPDELWDAVAARFSDVKRTGVSRLGGFARSERSKKYLFSGLLRCGHCNSRMVIVSGQGVRGYSKYGCPSHRNRGVCTNALTIRRDRLEKQLIAAIQEKLLTPTLLEKALRAFEQSLEKRLTALRREADDGADLRETKERLKQEASRIADAIAVTGHSQTLIERLQMLERKIAETETRERRSKSVVQRPSVDELRRFVRERIGNLNQLVEGDPERARTTFAKHLPLIVLTPSNRDGGPVFEVSGSWKLVPEGDALQVVARDGIEPPTPAFSGPRTPKSI
ncbi:MAG: recombinase family protein [Bryobacteraceae bacterium]